MTTAFPGAVDNFTNPTATDLLNSVTVPHAAQHANVNDAVEAIETAIGTTGAPVLAPLASPTFTGTVTIPSGASIADYAPLASPTFTGTPAAPTAAPATSTTQVATTDFVTTADNLKAPLASPTFTGVPAAPTAAPATSTTQIATTDFVTTADNLKADLASPTFTGVPAADTAAVATNTTQLATTAFVIANAGSSVPPFGFTAGLYYRTLGSNANNQTTVVNDTVYAPFIINETKTFDRIAIQSGASHSGTGSVRLGIYNNDGATGQPSTVLLDAGTVATTAANTIYEITISQSLPTGAYWIAFNMQTSPATPRYNGVSVNVASSFGYMASTTGSLTANTGLWIESGITGAFTTAGSLTSATTAATCTLRST